MAFTRPRAAQIDFDVTNISDPLIRLNSGQTGTPTKDVGLVIERGDSTNVAIIYDESADQFVAINTTEDGSTSGNVTISSYANIRAGTFYGDGSNLTGIPASYGDSDVGTYLSSNGYGTSSSIIASITDSAPSTLDTLNELAAALGDDANFATTTATSLGEKLAKASNLSDLTNAATARTNLGLGTAATTAATAYATAAQGTKADTAHGWGNHASAGYLTSYTETNDLSAAVTWANVPNANITQSSVTQHQAALSITESQISDLGTYLTASDITGKLNLSGGTMSGAIAMGTNKITGMGDPTSAQDAATKAYVDTQVSGGAGGGGGDVVDDTTPQLGGDLASNGNDVLFADNDKAIFGAGSDLQIYHDGSNSWINEVGTGQLILAGEDVRITTPNAGEFMATFGVNGAATLYYDNAAKLATTATGVDVTGGLTTTGKVTAAGGIEIPNQNAINELSFTGTEFTNVFSNTTSGFQLGTTGAGYLSFITNNAERLRIDSSGNVGIGTASPAATLESKTSTSGAPATSGTTPANVALRLSSTATTGLIDMGMNGASPFIQATDSGDLSQKYNLVLNPNGGNVGIGVTPTTPLDVQHSTGSQYVAAFKNAGDNLKIKIGTVNALLNIQGATVSSNAPYDISLNTEGGNVGIGVTPGTLLDVGDASSNTVARIRNLSGGGTNTNASFQLSTANNYINLTVNEQYNYTQFQHAGNLVNHYSDVDNHHFRTKAGAAKMTIDSSGNVDVTGSVNIGSTIGTRATSLSIEATGSNSPWAAKTSGHSTIASILPWASCHNYIGTGVYYDDGAWVHASDTTTNSLFALHGGGANWYASNNSTGSWNVASNALLWNASGQWTGDINTTYDINTGVITGTATAARYADLAEKYTTDYDYEAGTVLVFGGDEEVTQSTQRLDRRVAGIVSTDPAHLMNSELENSVAVGLQGRVPCKVVGEIRKGDMMVTSSTPGHAEAWREESNPPMGGVIGKALENKTGAGADVIEVVVGRL